MAKKKQTEKISLDDFVKMGTVKSRRGKPVSHSYLYRLIREHHAEKRKELPFKYVMEGAKDRIFIILDK